MAKSENITITGYLAFAKVYEPDTAFGKSEWKVSIFPEDEDEWATFFKSGIQKKVNENTDPAFNMPLGKYFSVTRATQKLFGQELTLFTAPVIEDAEGNTIVDYIWADSQKRAYTHKVDQINDIIRRGNPVLLGNGTKATIDITIFETIKGVGHRFNGIKVLELVEYKKEDKPLPPMSAVSW